MTPAECAFPDGFVRGTANYQLMMQLIDACRRYTIDEILELPDVKERVDLYRQQTEAFVAQLRRGWGRVRRRVVVDGARRHGPEPP